MEGGRHCQGVPVAVPDTGIDPIQQTDPPQVLAWTGKTLGITAVHVYRLEPRDGGTNVVTAESWRG